MTVKTSKGNITANRELLNYISIALYKAADDCRTNDKLGLAKSFDEMSDLIFDALNESGYYKVS